MVARGVALRRSLRRRISQARELATAVPAMTSRGQSARVDFCVSHRDEEDLTAVSFDECSRRSPPFDLFPSAIKMLEDDAFRQLTERVLAPERRVQQFGRCEINS